jgi:type I pantothenate kinase
VPVVSDFFDFSLYIDADVSVLRDWYVQRFLTFRDTRASVAEGASVDPDG